MEQTSEDKSKVPGIVAVENEPLAAHDQEDLHTACVNGNLDRVQYLIEKYYAGYPISTNDEGDEPLHIACANGKLNIVQYLIEKCKCDPMCINIYNGNTPLHVAASGKLDIVQYLITRCNCDPMLKNDYGIVPLHYACSNGKLDIVQYLLTECKCDPMCTNNDGRSPLHAACINGKLDIVQYLITECKCDPMCKSNDGRTPLHDACASCDQLVIVKYLITKSKCDPMCTDNDNNTPLHDACANGKLNIVQYLITECKCHLMCRNNDGNTPLHHACYKGKLNIVQYLIAECNCDPMCTNNYCRTPLHAACVNGALDIVKYLITECKCDPMCASKDNETPLHYACSNGKLDIIQYLITKCKCDQFFPDNNGRSPLHYACGNGKLDIAIYLITKCNCDPMCTNIDDETPLHYACNNGKLDIVKYLLTECKCDPMCTTKDGKTPLYFACFMGSLEVIKFLVFEFGLQGGFDTSLLEQNTTKLLDQFINLNKCCFVNSYSKVLLIGNSGAGKTTLAQVLIDRKDGAFLFGSFRSASRVKPFTAGIEPHKLEHKELGNVLLHDLAGQPQYYSSHSAVLENLLEGSPAAVFIIVAKLSEEPPYYWLNLVKDLSSKCCHVCYVLIVASHADTVHDRNHIKQLVENLNAEVKFYLGDSDHVKYIIKGPFYFDCRKLDSQQFIMFNNCLSEFCQSIRTAISTAMIHSEQLMHCRMLYLLLKSANMKVCSLDEVFIKVSIAHLNYYLPKNEDAIVQTLQYLHHFGLIMFINSASGSSIIVDKRSLLAEVNGTIFASDHQKKLKSNTGILLKTKLCELFQNRYDSSMLIAFLTSMKLCKKVTYEMIQLSNLLVEIDNNNDEEELLFFPALMSYNQRPTIHTSTAAGSDDILPFQFGWCLQCTSRHYHFSPQFLHLLILHLAFKHALILEPNNPLVRRCTIWSTGIMWKNGYSVNTLVELVDNNQMVVLLMSSQKGYEYNMVGVRRRVIADILSIQQEQCPSLQSSLKEFVIDPTDIHYPIDNLSNMTLYDIEAIASSVKLRKPFVVSYTDSNKEKLLSKLLPSEYEKGDNITQSQDISILGQRNLENFKLPGDCNFPDTISSSPVVVLRKHSADLVKAMDCPDQIAAELHSMGLISDIAVDDVLSARGLSKCRILMRKTQLMIQGGNEVRKFSMLCETLKNNCTDLMKEIVSKMETEVSYSLEHSSVITN